MEKTEKGASGIRRKNRDPGVPGAKREGLEKEGVVGWATCLREDKAGEAAPGLGNTEGPGRPGY